jgi:hypothetical protein
MEPATTRSIKEFITGKRMTLHIDKHNKTVILLLGLGCVLNGILAGSDIHTSVIEVPAWRKLDILCALLRAIAQIISFLYCVMTLVKSYKIEQDFSN